MTFLRSKKAFFVMFFLLTLLFFSVGTIKAQNHRGTDSVTIGSLENAGNNSYLPMNSLYEYSFSQQIYTAEEIGLAGTIDKLTVWMYGNANLYTMPFDIYMVEVDKDAFESTTDWVSVTSSDIVYTGNITPHNTEAEPYEFVLDTPFDYSGEGNLVIAFNNRTGSWKSGLNGKVFGASSDPYRAIYARRDGTIYDINNLPSATSFTYQRNVIVLDITTSSTNVNIQYTFEPEILGARPNGYWMEPATLTMSNNGSTVTVNSMGLDNEFFVLNAETPFEIKRNQAKTFEIRTGTAEAGEQQGHITIAFDESVGDTIIDINAIAYDAATPDVWELAQEVTSLPYQTLTTTEELYKNYNIPAISENAKDAVYKVTFTDDVALNVNVSGEDGVAAIYPENFNEFGGPSLDNTYVYNGPDVAMSKWFSYEYTGANTFYGSSSGGGMYYGYRIPTSILQEYGGDKCSLVEVESAARESYPYDLYVFRGGENSPMEGILIYSQEMGFNATAQSYFTIVINEPFVLGSEENIWIVLYSESPYAAYCGKNPVDTENGKIWYSMNGTTWSSNTTYTPNIFCHLLHTPSGRHITMNLADMTWKNNDNDAPLTEIDGNVNNESRFDINKNNAMKAANQHRDETSNQIENMFLPAGTYYVIAASSEEDFEVNMSYGEMPLPDTAVIVYPQNGQTHVVSTASSPATMEYTVGYYTKETQILIGTTNPPTTVLVDWTSNLANTAYLPVLEHNRRYYLQVNARNAAGVTEGNIINFSTTPDPVSGFSVANTNIFENETAILSWNAGNSYVIGYNVYQDGVKLNDELVTVTTYFVNNLAYNIGTGYKFQVSAVYEIGESALSSAKYVYVSGYGNINGHVYEQDGTTPIANATVTVNGINEFNVECSFEYTTNEEGYYSGTLYVGNYTEITAVCSGYQTVTYLDVPQYAAYMDTLSDINFVMDEEFVPVDYVTAEEEGNNVLVEWSYDAKDGNRSLDKYRVYRTTANNNGPYSIENTDLLGEVTIQEFVDTTWANITSGLYKFGVSCVYEGNRNYALVLSEDFDNGFPEGWIKITNGDGSGWMLGSEAALGNGHGHNGSNDMMISKSFQNNYGIYPDNYLVTPKVKLGVVPQFSFYACAQDENYPAEHFGVAVSTQTGYDPANFVMVDEWTMEAKGQGTWRKYTADLSAYAGQEVFIAIRHFDTYNQFYLDIDDVLLEDVGVQVERESEIVWSSFLGKDMYLVDGAVDITVTLTSGDTPDGITATFHNNTESEFEDIVVELNDNGYYQFSSIRKGDYTVTIQKDNYLTAEYTVALWSAISLEFTLDEALDYPHNVQVSPTGWVTWDAYNGNDRHFTGYYLMVFDDYNNYYTVNNLTENHLQIPVSDLWLYENDVYKVGVGYNYSSAYYTNLYSYTNVVLWKYTPCYNFEGASNVVADCLDDGVLMSWDYPEANTNNREMWQLLYSFDATSGYQYGIATDGNNIYTSSWSASSTSMFYKYDMQGNFIEEFNISGCGQLRGMTYDGEYFYGVANANTVYCVDLANHTLVRSFTTSYGAMRCITYDPLRNGFWVVGNWSGDLTLISRTGNIVQTASAPTSASDIAYFKDSNNIEHIYYLRNNTGSGEVYEYNITTNTMGTTPLFDCASNPAWTGGSGGCFVGEYNGKTCFFADSQQSPQLISIFELENAIHPVGAAVYVNNELVDFTQDNSYMFEGLNNEHSYGVKVVYNNNSMSCLQQAYPYTYHYNITENQYDNTMDIIGEIRINGELQNTLKVEIGAFVGTECRGRAHLRYSSETQSYLVHLTVYGEAGDRVRFSLYRRDYWETLSCDNVITFTPDAVIGTVTQPVVFNFFNMIYSQHTWLQPGWNWWSTYIEQDNIDGLTTMEEALSWSGEMIASQTAFTNNYGENGWYGSLTSINNESMYKIKMSDYESFWFTGNTAFTTAHPITINNGWNYIGFVSSEELDINDAFANLQATSGDIVKSQTAYANYYNGVGWFGSLNTLTPGIGLMYKSMNDSTTTFVYGDAVRNDLLDNNTAEVNHWNPNYQAYENNMAVTAVVEMNDEEILSENYELAAFANGECRGSIQLQYVDVVDRYIAFLTIAGDDTAELTFGLYNMETNEEFFNNELTITFVPNDIVGGLGITPDDEQPFVVTFRDNSSINEINNSLRIYPNPVMKGESINIMLDMDIEEARVEIVNSLGEVISTETITTSQSSIKMPDMPGVYMIRIITDSKNTRFSKIVVK